jgi:hypothetical protein
MSLAMMIEGLLQVLGRIVLMVLLCHARGLSGFGFHCFAIWALALPLPFSSVSHSMELPLHHLIALATICKL